MLFFFLNSAEYQRSRNTKKVTEADFQEKLLFTLIKAKRAQNVTKMEFFCVFIKFVIIGK